jgi:BirA family biotin operon repressor/biotin-[acetyl-CoA-carboxylase] ligase
VLNHGLAISNSTTIMYTRNDIIDGLNTTTIGRKLFVFDSLDSTNACARTLADAGLEEGTVVLADYQTAGRGRQGRSWLSVPAMNILLSIILRPSVTKEQASLLTFYAAVSVARVLERMNVGKVECKWPNDVLLNGRKCCGILLDNSFQQDRLIYSVVGIGMNVNQTQFDNGISTRATSLARESGSTFDRKNIVQSLLEESDRLLPSLDNARINGIIDEWKDRCTMFGKSVTLAQDDKTISGIAVRLEADGGLVLSTPSGQSTYYAGDVTIVQ